MPFLQSLTYVTLGRANTAHVDWHTHSGYMVDLAREALVETALNRGYSHLFFVDDDILPPVNTVDRLLGWRFPVCSGIYERRVGGLAQGMFTDDHSLVWTSMQRPAPGSGDVALISAAGAGCMMIDTRVFRRMSRPWFNYTAEGSEDMWFCRKLRDELLMPILCDTGVACGHEMSTVIQPGGNVVTMHHLQPTQQI